MEEEKLQAAKSILLENDGNKFAAIKAFMAQQGTDIDTAASYISQAYSALDSPAPQPMLPAAPPDPEPHEVVVKEYVVKARPEPEVNAGLVIYAIIASIAKAAIELGWLFLKILLYCVFILPFTVLTFLLIFFYADKAMSRRKRDYWGW